MSSGREWEESGVWGRDRGSESGKGGRARKR